MRLPERVVLLAGGVGGAKLAVGLANVLPPRALTIVVNTADDFRHLGVYVSPDLDTVMYSLAGLANPQTGWGVRDDTFQMMEMVARYSGPTWFRLGDRDMATSLMRTDMLAGGRNLTAITHHLAQALGVKHAILPMTDYPVSTWLETDQGSLVFQEYFVREHWQPVVTSISFRGVERACATPEVARALESATLIIFGPSNPFLSLDPILAVPGIRERIAASEVACMAVSPIIGGQAVKGPAAKLMAELGYDVSPLGIARHYEDLLDGIILDEADRHLCNQVEKLKIRANVQHTLMDTLENKTGLAKTLLEWAEEF